MTYRIDDPQHGGSELSLAALPPSLNGLDVRLYFGLLPVEDDPERDIHLGMNHALLGELANHVVANQLVVFRSLQPFRYCLERRQEPEKVLILVKRTRSFERQRLFIMAFAQLHKS